MSKANEALKQVLEQYGISHNRLAVTMGVERYVVQSWTEGFVEVVAEQVPEVLVALETLEPGARELFLRLYLDEPDADGQPALVR